MKRIFVDFEMHPISKKYGDVRKICAQEIIEIGAVMLDEDYKEISSFKEYVKPEYNSKIYKKYEELTGISTKIVAGANKFKEALIRFMEWCGEFDYEIYTWSNSDKKQIIKEIKLKHFECGQEIDYMLEHWIDFQEIFGSIVGADHLISLENALASCGIRFSGRKHDALFDARNTSLLFVETMLNDISKIIASIKKYVIGKNDEPITVALGDLFDFATLNYQFS